MAKNLSPNLLAELCGVALVQISIDPRVHLLVDLEVGHSTAAINPVKTRMERDKEAETIRCFDAKVSAVIGKCGMCLHLRLFIRIAAKHLLLEIIVTVP